MRRSAAILAAFLLAACAAGAYVAAADAHAVSAARQIACVRQARVGQEIWLMSDSGAKLRRLTRIIPSDYYQNRPFWSPGGEVLAYVDWTDVTNGTGARLWAVSPDGSGAHRLLPEGVFGYQESVESWLCCPAWSADGTRVALLDTMNWYGNPVNAWTSLVTYDFTTGVGAELYRLPQNWTIRGLAWSGDGATVEFLVDNSARYSRSTVRASGRRSLLRSIETATGTVRTLASAPKGTLWSGISRSPDGRKVAITQTPWRGGRAAVKLAPMGGAPNRTLVRAFYATTKYDSPTWSPNGTRIAYGLSSPNGDSVWIVRVDGSGDHKAISNMSQPAWRTN